MHDVAWELTRAVLWTVAGAGALVALSVLGLAFLRCACMAGDLLFRWRNRG